MDTKYQRGELSLFWAAAFVGVVTLCAVAVLLSMRHERNLFDEAWHRIKRTDAGKNLQARVAEKTVESESAAIRKCMVGGKVVYSNLECETSNPTSRQVQLHVTQGIESAKVTPLSTSSPNAPETLQDRMIEKAVQR